MIFQYDFWDWFRYGTRLTIFFEILITVVIVLSKFLLPIFCVKIAGEKGYSKVGFYFYGLLSFTIALGVAILAPPRVVLPTEDDKIQEQLQELQDKYKAGKISYTEMCRRSDEISASKYK